MTEQEWLSCTDSAAMLEFLRDRIDERKMRLFGVACCRRIWQLLNDERSRTAVEKAELFADGKVSQEEVTAAGKAAKDVWDAIYRDIMEKVCQNVNDMSFGTQCVCDAGAAAMAAQSITERGDCWPEEVPEDTARCFAYLVSPHIPSEYFGADEALRDAATAKERHVQAILLRCIFGNPYRPLTIPTSLLNDSVLAIARGIYDERAFERMPVLADALEECDLTEAEALAHLRGPGPHARGCWVIDLLLAKE